MDRKLKNTFALLGIIVGILVVGFAFILIFQKPKIKKKTKEYDNLKATEYDTKLLTQQLQEKEKQARVLDSILAARKFNIPKNLAPIRFYEFMNQVARLLSEDATLNVEYQEKKQDKNFFYYEYKLSGIGTYNDVYQVIYAVEQSKELKKISNINLSNYVSADADKVSVYLVQYNLTVGVYFSDNDRFTSSESYENELRAPKQYDIFYPLILTTIPPNIDELLDVQGARLLAIIPEGAFLSDIKGESFLLSEGDKVYLGYMTQIDRKNNRVKFILNKGGIIESVEIPLEKEIPKAAK
jgi:ribulose bisphosphate carboxylase small subunit